MEGRNGTVNGLIGAAVAALFLLPADGSAQQDIMRPDPCISLNIVHMSALASLIGCATAGYAPDQYAVGLMFANGIEVAENDAEAVRWFRMAAEHGHPASQHDLGLMYAEGEGVPEDDEEAVRWYRLAYEQDLTLAQFALGAMYSRGEGIRTGTKPRPHAGINWRRNREMF